MKKLEDFHVGQCFDYAVQGPDSSAIMDFAREWDPQRLHLDLDHATALHGSLIASGFQTMLLVFQPLMHNVLSTMDNIGGLGMDRLRWLHPLRPDQELKVRMEVTGITPSRSKPDRGVLAYSITATDPQGQVLMTVDTAVMVRRRTIPPPSPEEPR